MNKILSHHVVLLVTLMSVSRDTARRRWDVRTLAISATAAIAADLIADGEAAFDDEAA